MFAGSCHCGAVRFRVDASITELTTCDCSLCAKRCGIYVFHRKRSAPNHFGINVFCLEGFDAASVPIRTTEGAAMSVEQGDLQNQRVFGSGNDLR